MTILSKHLICWDKIESPYYIKKWLSEGVSIPFISEPPPNELDNYISNSEQEKFIDSKIPEYLTEEYISEVSEKPVSVLEGEARLISTRRTLEGLRRLATTGTVPNAGQNKEVKERLDYPTLKRFLEEHLTSRLKQVTEVWVQGALLRAELAKVKSRMDKRDDILNSDALDTSQVNYLKKRLEHDEVQTRVQANNITLAKARTNLEKSRRQANDLHDTNTRSKTRLMALRAQEIKLQEEERRQKEAVQRISRRIEREEFHEQQARETMRINKYKRSTSADNKTQKKQQVLTVDQYLVLSNEVQQLEKEIKKWRQKKGIPNME